MRFHYYGHSCFSLEINDKVLLFDPFITGNPSTSYIDIFQLRADYILVSHGHADHTLDLLAIARTTNAQVISAFEITEWCAKHDYMNGIGVNFGGELKLDFGTVKFLPAWHSSSLPDGSYGGNPGGFLIQSTEGNIYYSGDTALMMDMKLIPLWTSLDWAILPIGGTYTMGVDDAIIASDFIECDQIIGVHFDTFDAIQIDEQKSQEKFKSKNKNLILPTIDTTIELKK